jgi:hypothetical protein
LAGAGVGAAALSAGVVERSATGASRVDVTVQPPRSAATTAAAIHLAGFHRSVPRFVML